MINEFLFLLYVLGLPVGLVILTRFVIGGTLKSVRSYALLFLRSLPILAGYVGALYYLEVHGILRSWWASPTLIIALPTLALIAGGICWLPRSRGNAR